LKGFAKITGMTMALMAASGCFPQAEDAPGDLDGLAHWFWNNHQIATDVQIAEALLPLQEALETGIAADPEFSGTLSDLEEGELDATDIEEKPDPSKAQGLFIGNRFHCELPILDEIVTDKHQDDNYLDVYESYNRTFTSDLEAYQNGDASVLTWHTEVTAKPVSAAYHSKLNGGIRRLDDPPALVQFAWFTEPADFEDENSSFDQDYQLEVYFLDDDKEVLHLEGIWREMVLGIVSIEDDVVIDFTLGALFDWDTRTEELCAERQ
jgi:hypothetical protein